VPNVYKLTRGDKDIFSYYEKTKNPDVLTNFYLRSETSGTWWLPGTKTIHWQQGYDRLFQKWKAALEPDVLQVDSYKYDVRWQHEESKDYPDLPAFFHNHGALMLPYAKMLHDDRHPVRICVGGFGSGKTFNSGLSLVVDGMTHAQFRGFALAPMSIQALEVYEIIMNFIADTEFERRFLLSAPTKPFPKIIFGHDGIGISKIECYPIAGRENKLRTLTGDRAIIDQAESELLDLPEILRSIGTRFRGRVSKNGRSRIGTLTFLANSGDKQDLWDLYDEAEYDKENYLSLSPSSYDNPYLTDKDIKRFELQVGATEETKDVYMKGKRPLGNGQHFSKAVLESLRLEYLDDEMEEGLKKQHETGKEMGYIKLEAKNVGCYEWLLPYKPDHRYMVMSDPGTQNPPARDSAPIFVWDITHFPGTLENPVPATLAGFVWPFVNKKINNWANRFSEIVWRYHALGTCAFDATGYQSGYDQWMPILNALYVEKISLAGNNKPLCLNAAKMLTSREMLKMPGAVSHVFQQLARYEFPPEPVKLRQDLVMAFIMSAWWMQRLFYFEHGDFQERPDYDPDDRYNQPMIDRYSGNAR
jgi:hypothetical protein